MSFAEVCVNLPAGRGQLFTYRIPSGMDVTPGFGVWVPFGPRLAQGIVVALTEVTNVEAVRPLTGLIQAEPLLSPLQLSLAVWIADYYRASLFDVLTLFLPPGFAQQALPHLTITERAACLDEEMDPIDIKAVRLLKEKGTVAFKALGETFGKSTAESIIARLLENGYAEKTFEMTTPHVRTKTVLFVGLAAMPQDVPVTTSRSLRQADLLDYLRGQSESVPLAQLVKQGFRRDLIKTLVKMGALVIEARVVTRRPRSSRCITPDSPYEPTIAQQHAITTIGDSIATRKLKVFLLHGVTGSGKTEVYLQALAHAVRLGRQGIILVPEIALTPQTIERFEARFPGKTAVLHSKLSLGEQYDTWKDISRGVYDVVVGARSALFAPLPKLGLIVMDEEHEWTYKQSDCTPRYHARTVALKLAALSGATVVLGSATPDVESYYYAKMGTYRLIELPERITPRPGAPLPAVSVVDLRAELKTGNRSIFSTVLLEGMQRALACGDQIILFFNRRGSAVLVQCRACGHTMTCSSCSVALSHHGIEKSLVCHRCGRRSPVPLICPTCNSRRIRFLGLGIQKVMEEVAILCPEARILRWDSDTTRGKDAHADILARMRRYEADILVGTQLVAKGLDLPRVTFVGVVSADTALGLPDFRAGERTFQLLSQVAGRAGRGLRPGQVVIQTFAPEHYAVQAAAAHYYRRFYQREIEYRRALGNPPFSQLACLTFVHKSEAACLKEAENLRQQLVREIQARGLVVSVIGPAPAFFPRIRGRYRWQLTLKGSGLGDILRSLELPSNWIVDVDPVGL